MRGKGLEGYLRSPSNSSLPIEVSPDVEKKEILVH